MEKWKISEETACELLEALVKNGETAKLCVESSREALGKLGISNNDNDKSLDYEREDN